VDINTSKAHQATNKDTTVSKSSAAAILDGNANREKEAEEYAKKMILNDLDHD